jgi:ferredoxin
MFVLQSTSSNLYALRERIARGLTCRGPALFTVFPGTEVPAAGLSSYLTAAAAMDARAFPAFTYDAAAGPNWAARFSLENNPEPDADWRSDEIEYADEALQRVREATAFTFADFALCDARYAEHFALVPRERWNATMIPAAHWLALDERDAAQRVPYLLAVDADDALHRIVVDARLMAATRRCLLLWHRLQEHGGVHDSHAERLLAAEKAAWDAQKQRELDDLRSAAPTAAPAAEAAAVPAAAVAAPAEAAADKPPSDDPWIETARCPSCGECTTINDRMFGYNDNKQAFIKDPAAGTYKQLVEAAESCQVAIIHPGKPRDPNEPGLAELLERAKPFL